MDISEENAYCRLCADLKLCSLVSDMEINVDKRQGITNKLKRFNVLVNFNNVLPKTVCFECINSLERAFDFITTVEQAQQAFNSECNISNSSDIKKKEADSDNESLEYEHLIISHEDDCFKDEEVVYDVPIGKEIKIEYEKNKNDATREDPKPKTHSNLKFRSKRKHNKLAIEFSESWDDCTWSCGCCNKQCETVDELRVHSMQFHSTCNAYKCSDCGTKILHLDDVIPHICKHQPFLILTCYKCSYKCSSLRQMKIHKASHIESDYFCVGCNTTFSSQDELDEHTHTYYKDESSVSFVKQNDSLTCIFCQKLYKNMFLLKRHLFVHSERKRDHVCNICGKGFMVKKDLTQHLIVHSDERPFKCEICKSTYKIRGELRKHVQIHLGVKPFACDKCGKCFRQKKQLLVHSVVHTDEKPYACKYCEKSFRFRHLLQQHNLLHTGIKPYTCEVCPQTFRNWSNWHKHMKTAHAIDKTKRKHTPDGDIYSIDPTTGQILYPEDPEKINEWKKNIMEARKKGRPKKISKN